MCLVGGGTPVLACGLLAGPGDGLRLFVDHCEAPCMTLLSAPLGNGCLTRPIVFSLRDKYRFATFKLYNNRCRGSHNSVLSFVLSISRFPGGLGFVQGCKLFRHLGTLCPVIMTSFLPLLPVGVELMDRVPSSLGTVCGSGFVLGFFSSVHLGWMWWSLRGLGC